MSTRLEKPSFTREHRLGLVVYGGVSLAIYMNGICQEFFNAVRGKGIYKLIKALTDADIVVDILSGTSAGGINSVLLSYALANSDDEEYIPFDEFAKIWLESGDIKKLLYASEYDGYYKRSFFDGVNYYKSQLKSALIGRSKKEASRSDWPSPVNNLDLFVTGTDLLGRIYETFDNTGRIIEVKDHRTIFHLKHRESGSTAFRYQEEETCEALAKLCQITSCFPGAFPPVTVHIGDEDRDDPLQQNVDRVLTRWGKLRKNRKLPKLPLRQEKHDLWDNKNFYHRAVKNKIDDDLGRGHRLHFVDGGVLDNRPFSYAIETIYRRTAERRIFRKLFYVDPSPDRFLDNSRYRQMQKPDLIQVIADSLSALPRYESINNDLELIKKHNEKVRRYKFLLADIETLLDHEQKDDHNKDMPDQQVYVYKRARLLKLKDKLVSQVYLESNDCIQDFKEEAERSNRSQATQNPSHPVQEKELSQNFQAVMEELTARLDIAPELNDELIAAHKQVKQLLQLDQELSTRRDLDKAVELLTKPLEPDENAEWVSQLEAVYKETDGLDTEFALRKHSFMVDYIQEILDANDLRKWFIQKLKQWKTRIDGKSLSGDYSIEHNLRSLNTALNIDRNFLDSLLQGLENLSDAQDAESMCSFITLQDLASIVDISQTLVKDLNIIVKQIQDINKEIEDFFSSRLVSQYFKELIEGIEGDSRKKQRFPFDFYNAMCFLHKKLLYLEPPDSPPANRPLVIPLPEALINRLKELHTSFLNKHIIHDASLITHLSAYKKETSISTKEEFLKTLASSKGDITILKVFSLIGEDLIKDRLTPTSTDSTQSNQENLLNQSNAQVFLLHFLKETLKKYFTEFVKLDEFLFPLDYLADISEKQLIETYRISPEDARYGLSTHIMRGKRLEQKLAGDSLNAFGGFLKQSWRENDILWGQLDGLNRIVESLVTDEQIQRFPSFWEQQAKKTFPNEKDEKKRKESYLDRLLDEALSIRRGDKSNFKQQLKQDLKIKIETVCNALMAKDNCIQEKEAEKRQSDIAKYRAILVQSIVRAGHLLILDEQRKTNGLLDEALKKRPSFTHDIFEDKQVEAAFREHYRIGLETLKDIPKADWQEIKNRFFAIASDIIKTYRHKRYKRFESRSTQTLSKLEDNPLIKFVVFPLLFAMGLVFLIANAFFVLIFILILMVCSLPMRPGLFSRRVRAKRMRIAAYKYSLAVENLFLTFLVQASTSIFKGVLSISTKWKRIFNTPKKRAAKRKIR